MRALSLLKSVVAVLALSCVTSSTAKTVVASQNSATESRRIEAFQDIDVKSTLMVKYVTADSYSVKISAPSNVLPHVILDNDEGELEIKISSNVRLRGKSNVVVTLYAPTLRDIEMSGAATLMAEQINHNGKMSISGDDSAQIYIGNLKSNQLEIDAEGGSTIDINSVNSASMEVEGKGAATINLSGKANVAEIETEGAATVDAKNLSVSSGKVSAQGASTIKANFDKYLSQSCSVAAKLDI